MIVFYKPNEEHCMPENYAFEKDRPPSNSSTVDLVNEEELLSEMAKMFINFTNQIKSITTLDSQTTVTISSLFKANCSLRSKNCPIEALSVRITESLKLYHQLIELLKQLAPNELDPPKKLELLSQFNIDVIHYCMTQIQANAITNAGKIVPSFKHRPELELEDLQHAYVGANTDSLDQDAIKTATKYENSLRIGIRAMILFAELQITNNQYSIETQRKNKKLFHVVRRRVGTDEIITNIYGDAPMNVGKKNLYSTITPSGAQCLLGYRLMGESTNYCCYPMATLTTASESWIEYEPMYKQQIYRNKTPLCMAKITGIHLTLPITNPEHLYLCPLSKARKGTQYIGNGSHASIDCKHITIDPLLRTRSLGFFRLQLRPRIETATAVGQTVKFVLRGGRSVLMPLRLSDKDRLPLNSLTELKTVLNRETRDGFLIKEGESYTEEHQFIQSVLDSTLYLAGQSVITEIAMIGKMLESSHNVNLTTSDVEILDAYQKILTKFEDNPNYLSEIQKHLNIVDNDPVAGLSPLPSIVLSRDDVKIPPFRL